MQRSKLFVIIYSITIERRRVAMVTGQLEHAFKLAEKHMLEVQTILDFKRIIAKEVNGSTRTEEKILQAMIQLLENNKTILQEAQ